MMTQSPDPYATIDELHIQLMEERQARRELENELHVVHKFIRRAGHDLRTPVTTLKTSLYLLQRKPQLATPDRLNMMEGQLDRLAHLIDGMEMMARLEDLHDLDYDEVDVCVVIQEALWTIADDAKQRGIVLVKDFADVVPPARLNFEEMKRAIANLLDNAIRYSGDASAVYVRVYEMHGYVCIDVADSGIGLNAPDVDHLFVRFYRGVEASQIHQQGAGMGLPITKRIVELHEGKMRVMSTEGNGSTFRMMLPVLD